MERGPDTPFANIAITALAAALTIAAGLGAFLARSLGVWRAAISAMIALAGAALVGVLTTAADIAGGVGGLLVLAAICPSASLGAWRLRPTRGSA